MYKFARSDQRGCIFGFAILAAIVIGMMADRYLLSDSTHISSLGEMLSDSSNAETAMADTDAVQRELETAERYYPVQETVESELFRFDPNLADSIELLRLGFAPWMVKNLCHYRAKGGRFHRVEDMKRIYGMTPELYERISPYAYISRQFRYYEDLEPNIRSTYAPLHPDTTRNVADSTHHKFTEHVILDLNAADTATLRRIPGIGPIRSQRITDYREALGGYVSPAQLHEIDGLPAGIETWFTVEMGVFRKININTDDVRTMSRHPYMSYTQARAIERLRRSHGRINNIHELQLMDTFTEDDIVRLEPYIAY